MKTFFVLWLWIGAGATQTISTDHYATREECEAAKAAIVEHYQNSWINGEILKVNIVCLEAKVK